MLVLGQESEDRQETRVSKSGSFDGRASDSPHARGPNYTLVAGPPGPRDSRATTRTNGLGPIAQKDNDLQGRIRIVVWTGDQHYYDVHRQILSRKPMKRGTSSARGVVPHGASVYVIFEHGSSKL
jgi:hypothetical protein